MTVYLSHATGFCGGVWAPVVEDLGSVETVAWDFPGHGSGPRIETPLTWQVFGEFVLDSTRPGGVGVGHSMGAAALLMAQLVDPRRFRALVLVEPIVFPPPHQRVNHPLASIAIKRKREFPNREEALANFAERGAFSDWDDMALRGYVDCGFLGNDPIALACDPEVEAEIYETSNEHDTWDRLEEIEIPTVVLAGAHTDTIKPELARAQAALMGGGVEIVPDTGHFLPMERPDLIAQRTRRMVEAVA